MCREEVPLTNFSSFFLPFDSSIKKIIASDRTGLLSGLRNIKDTCTEIIQKLDLLSFYVFFFLYISL